VCGYQKIPDKPIPRATTLAIRLPLYTGQTGGILRHWEKLDLHILQPLFERWLRRIASREFSQDYITNCQLTAIEAFT